MNAATFAGEYDVAIVGLGPTGLTLAHLLGLRGLRVLALEREPEFYGNARAVYTDDECMRVFQAAGVAAELEADMLVDTPVQWVLEDGSVLEPASADGQALWLGGQQFLLPTLSRNQDGEAARTLSERDGAARPRSRRLHPGRDGRHDRARGEFGRRDMGKRTRRRRRP